MPVIDGKSYTDAEAAKYGQMGVTGFQAYGPGGSKYSSAASRSSSVNMNPTGVRASNAGMTQSNNGTYQYAQPVQYQQQPTQSYGSGAMNPSHDYAGGGPGMGFNNFVGGPAYGSAFANTMGQMNNIGNLVGGAFQQTNQMNQENAQWNDRMDMAASAEQAKNDRMAKIMPMIQQLMGNMSGGGASPSRGFQATNFSQGGSLNY